MLATIIITVIVMVFIAWTLTSRGQPALSQKETEGRSLPKQTVGPKSPLMGKTAGQGSFGVYSLSLPMC